MSPTDAVSYMYGLRELVDHSKKGVVGHLGLAGEPFQGDGCCCYAIGRSLVYRSVII
jgi:hypothetical protein